MATPARLHDTDGTELAPNLAKRFFEQMVRIRTVETWLLRLYAEGYLRGTVHTCLGQEATAVGTVGALDLARDIVCSNHRGHGHFLAYCGEVKGLIAEIMGRSDGVCGGVGGSQHLHLRNFYSNGILGGMSPVTAGMALAEKQRGSGAVAVVFHGDGAMAEGAIYEAMNMAALWKLPMVFAFEQNQFAQSTPFELEHAGALERRAEPFGIPVFDVDGNDVAEVHGAATAAVAAARSGAGPQALFMRTYRLGPHSKGDDLRSKEEIERHRRNEPIGRLRARLAPAWCDETVRTVESEIGAIVEALKRQSPGSTAAKS